MLPVSLPIAVKSGCITNPVGSKPLSSLEYHSDKSKNLLNKFFIALSDDDLETIKKICEEVSNELNTVTSLLEWDSDKAVIYSEKINPPINAESLEQLKGTAYAPIAKYLAVLRKHDKPLDEPLIRWEILSILDEAEKSGASSDCISLIRDRCLPLELDPAIMHHKERSLADLNRLLWCILNRQEKAIYSIYESDQNELWATAYLLLSNIASAGEPAKRSNPPIDAKHVEHLKNTAYVPMVRYFILVQNELTKRSRQTDTLLNKFVEKCLDILEIPHNRSELRSILLQAEKLGANPEYVSMLRYIGEHLPG